MAITKFFTSIRKLGVDETVAFIAKVRASSAHGEKAEKWLCDHPNFEVWEGTMDYSHIEGGSPAAPCHVACVSNSPIFVQMFESGATSFWHSVLVDYLGRS